MKRLAYGFVLALLIVAAPSTVAAHELKQDNGVIAVLHIEPADRPVAQQPTKIEVEFASTAGGFSIKNYTTTLNIVENNRTIKSYRLVQSPSGANGLGEATVIFPAGSIYGLEVVGEPKVASAPAFTFDYVVRATGPATTANAKSAGLQTILISIASLILLAMVAATNIRAGRRYSTAKPITNGNRT